MSLDLTPLRFVAVALAGWLNQQQHDIIDYLREENKVLREQLGNRRLRLNDEQRRRLAVRAKKLGHKVLAEVASVQRIQPRARAFPLEHSELLPQDEDLDCSVLPSAEEDSHGSEGNQDEFKHGTPRQPKLLILVNNEVLATHTGLGCILRMPFPTVRLLAFRTSRKRPGSKSPTASRSQTRQKSACKRR